MRLLRHPCFATAHSKRTTKQLKSSSSANSCAGSVAVPVSTETTSLSLRRVRRYVAPSLVVRSRDSDPGSSDQRRDDEGPLHDLELVWASERLDVRPSPDRPECFLSVDALEDAPRGTFDPPQSGFRVRTEFLDLKQDSVSVFGCIRRVRYLSTCGTSSRSTWRRT